jgi:photosystem II stability/assembly factor-like uncharacterized protein
MSKSVFPFWLVQKIALLSLVSVAVLFTAASCSWNPFSNNNVSVGILGIIKQDPAVKANTFGKINAVKAINGKTDPDGLTSLSVVKVSQVDTNVLFALTQEKGVFKTSDAGKTWQRIYVFPVTYTEDKDKVKEMEAAFKRNDDIQITNFWVQFDKPNTIYISAKDGNVGKIFKTTDGGKTVREVYVSTGIESSSVDFVVIDPTTETTVYGLTSKNTLLQSLDGGETWKKINDYTKDKDRIIQIGILPLSKNFFILSEKNGLSTSIDGTTWEKKVLTKKKEDAEQPISADTKIQQIQRKILPQTLPAFNQYQKIIPIATDGLTPEEPAIILADKEIWFTTNLVNGTMTQIKNLPIEGEKVQIQDIAVDPILGTQKLYVASGNRLLVSDNGGETWANKKLSVEGIGNISRIIIDKVNPDIIYLALRK